MVGLAEEGVFEGVCCFALEEWFDVRVGVHGDADLGVAECLHDHAWVDAECDEDGGAAVAQVVKP